ncbi:MAG: hypothetical protein ACKVY0_17330 [Prosthecobacter sp.]|uniref:hypothetical protein n=1 Tax=Prosthecobacter sp. TaxID=1965333 RepID=UPI003902B021
MYILDTSAIRGIRGQVLSDLPSGIGIAISPLTFYELLCHLDEQDRDGNFARQKGNLLKCMIPDILQDPFAAHANSVGVEDLANPTRFGEPDVIRQTLKNLASCDSLKNFYETDVVTSEGERRNPHDMTARAVRVLADEEAKYVKMIKKICAELKTEFQQLPAKVLSQADIAWRIGKSAHSLFKSYEADIGQPDENLMLKVICSVYNYMGYINCRALGYIANGTESNVDTNDCEDACISLHLDILRGDTLVTNDTGTIKALNTTIESFRSIAAPGIVPRTRVIDSTTFMSEVVSSR